VSASEFLGVRVRPGETVRARVPVAELADGTSVTLPLTVIGGRQEGPVLYLQAGIHGDEVTGIEILTRACRAIDPGVLHGTIGRSSRNSWRTFRSFRFPTRLSCWRGGARWLP